MNDFEKCWINGCFISRISTRELFPTIKKWIEMDVKSNYIIPMNMGKLVMSLRDNKLAACIHHSSINIADGLSLVFASYLIGKPVPERITGVEFMESLLNLADKNRYKIYLLGARQQVLDLCIQNIKRKFPNLTIVGYHNGYFDQSQTKDIVKSIALAAPDLLFIGMGMPQKEYFIYDHYKELNACVILPVGGAFDVIAGVKKRAPVFIQKIGIEWLWRSIYDPSRLFLVLKSVTGFTVVLIKEIFRQRILRKEEL